MSGATAMVANENPYVGPRSFTTRDRNRFYGRDRESRDLLSLVISERLVLFYAQSGAGKSSLINARLLPEIKEEGFLVLPTGRVSGQLPAGMEQVDNIFIYNLLVSLDQSNQDIRQFSAMRLNHFLANLVTTDGETYFYDDSPADSDEENDQVYRQPPHLLVIDQFEEIFSTNLEYWEQRGDFFEQLNQAMEDDPLLWVVLVLREDYVAALDPFTGIMSNRMRARQYMQRMGYESALEAVKKPAELGGRPFEVSVAEELVDNLRLVRAGRDQEGNQEFVAGEFIEPVQLQVVCFQLWENLRSEAGDSITQEDLRKLARGSDLAQFINRALGEFYEQAVARVVQETGETERKVRAWFSKTLITEAETRGYVYQGEKTTGGLSNEAVRLLQEQYIIRSEPKAGGTWIELVHDRFIGPILRLNRDWEVRHQNPLNLDAEAWRESGRDPDKLYEGAQLQQALEQAEANPDELSELAEEFLQVSQDRAQEKAAARQRRILQGAVALIVVLTVLTGWAIVSSIRASQNAAEARVNRDLALVQQSTAEGLARARGTQQSLAEAARSTAVAAADESATQQAIAVQQAEARATQQAIAVKNEAMALQQQNIAISRQLAAQANSFLDTQPDLAALLGIEALGITDTVEAKGVLLSVLQQSLGQSFQEFGGPIPAQATDVNAVAISPDGSRLAWASSDGSVLVWNLAEQYVEKRLLAHTRAVLSLAFSPDGGTLASAGRNTDIVLWDLETEQTVSMQNKNFVLSLSYSPDGSRLAAAVGPTVTIWRVDRWQETTPIRESEYRDGHNNTVRSVAWSPDGRRIASGGDDRRVILWDPELGIPVQNHRQQGNQVSSVAWDPASQLLVSASEDGTLLLWDATRGRSVRPPVEIGDGDALLAVVFSSDGDLLAAAGEDNNIYLLETDGLSEIARLEEFHTRSVVSLAFSPLRGQNLLASSSYDDSIGFFQIITEQPLSAELFNRPDPILALFGAASSQPSWARSGSGVTEVWTLAGEDPELVGQIAASANTAAFSPDGARLAMGSEEGRVAVANIETGEILNSRDILDGPINALAFTPDGGQLAFSQCSELFEDEEEGTISCLSSLIVFWDPGSGEERIFWSTPAQQTQSQTNQGHAGFIHSLAFNPAGTLLASGGQDKTILLWDVLTGEQSGLALSQHKAAVTSLAFSPAGDTLASGDEEKNLILWDVLTRRPLGEPLTGSPGSVISLLFADEGNRLLAGSDTGALLAWDVGLASWIERVCRLAGRNLTEAEWTQFIPNQPLEETCDPELFSMMESR